MKIEEVLDRLEVTAKRGFQLSKRRGMLSSTWLIYKANEFYYYFDINEEIKFKDENQYTRKELLETLKGSYFEIEETIS